MTRAKEQNLDDDVVVVYGGTEEEKKFHIKSK